VYTPLRIALFFLIVLSSGHLSAHELTPTYIKLRQSYVENVLTTRVNLWNGRADVLYYKLNVYNKDWEKVPFFSLPGSVVKVDYTERMKLDVFIGAPEAANAVYVCTRSQILKGLKQKTVISSKICSKIIK